MKLSWSHKLFLEINSRLGVNLARDKFMSLAARWLIYVLVFYTLFWLIINFDGPEMMERVIFFAGAAAVAFLVSLVIGLLVSHPRPEVEFPRIKQLIRPIARWKSFPSDHTTISFLLAYLVIIFGGAAIVWMPMLALSTLIAASRVYAGVHYPRDIIGGFILASGLALGLSVFMF